MDIFYNKLEADPSTIGMDVVGGRLDLVSATSIRWSFLNSNQIRLVNPDTGRWELVKVATEPTIDNTDLDLNGAALAVDKIYDVFAEYSSGTAFTLVASRWQTATAGTSSRVATYDAGTTYAIGDRVTYDGHDWVKQSSAAAGTTPVAGNDWVDNGTSVSGDFSGLYRHDGVLVSDSSDAGKSRRWLGIIYTYSNGGTVNFKDEATLRYISNYYNTKQNNIYSTVTTGDWSYTGTWREVKGGGSAVTRGQFLSCVTQNINTITGNTAKTPTGWYYIGPALNGTSYEGMGAGNNGSTMIGISCGHRFIVPVGFNYLTATEYSDGGGSVASNSFHNNTWLPT